MPNLSNGLRQAYDVQDFAYEAVMSLRDSLNETGKLRITREDADAIAKLGRVWESAQLRIAFHRRVPSPGSLRPTAPKRKVRRGEAAPFVVPVVYPSPGDVAMPAVVNDAATNTEQVTATHSNTPPVA